MVKEKEENKRGEKQGEKRGRERRKAKKGRAKGTTEIERITAAQKRARKTKGVTKEGRGGKRKEKRGKTEEEKKIEFQLFFTAD